jgi:hypothetical protein
MKMYPFVETEATRYGNELHKAAELYVGEGTPLPKQFAYIQETLDALIKKPGRKLAEYKMTLTEDLTPTEWFAKDAWVRGVADLLIIDDENLTAWVADWKTGNNKYPDRDQLTLMSLMVFTHFPHIRRVTSALLFVLKNDMVKSSMLVGEAPDAWADYRERVARIEKAHETNVWNPKPTPLCGWCSVKTCEYNTKRN